MSQVNVKEWDGTGSLPMLYSRTATGAINVWMCWVFEDEVRVSWGQMNGTLQEAAFKCLPKNVGKKNETTAHQQAVKEAISKWEKQVKKKYSPSLETAGKTKRIQPMLAQHYPDHRDKVIYPAAIQPKLDGVRCLTYLKDGEVYLQSRGGDPYKLDHVKNEMVIGLKAGYEDYVFDGELYIHGASLQSITSLARKPRQESLSLIYCIYDMFKTGVESPSWWVRWQMIERFFTLWQTSFRTVWKVPTVVVNNAAAVDMWHKHFVEEGYEGAILRTQGGLYAEGCRSADLLKIKAWEDAEYLVKGWYVGKGKFENVPMFICVTPEGKEFAVTPVGTREERYMMLQAANSYIGKLMKVKYLDKTEDGAPKCARGLGLRDASDMS